jgi:hypothetical protein
MNIREVQDSNFTLFPCGFSAAKQRVRIKTRKMMRETGQSEMRLIGSRRSTRSRNIWSLEETWRRAHLEHVGDQKRFGELEE